MAPKTPVVSERPLPEWAAGPRLREAPMSSIAPSPHNPRKTFDDLDELVESIREHGVLQPIILRPDKKPKLEIVAGERRYRAAKKLGLATIPARVEPFTPEEAREVQIIENLQRTDLSVIEEATGFKALIDSGRYDVGRLAETLGKSASFIYQRLKLLEAHPQILDHLANGHLEAGHVLLLARCDPEVQLEILLQAEVRDFRGRPGDTPPRYMSVQALGALIVEMTRNRLDEAPWDLAADIWLTDKPRGVQPPPCTVCNRNSSVQGGLFPEIHEAGICADVGCYRAKWVATVRAAMAATTTDEGEPVAVMVDRLTGGRSPAFTFAQGPIGRAIAREVGGHIYITEEYARVPKGYTGRVPQERCGVVVWSGLKSFPVGSKIRVSLDRWWKPSDATDAPAPDPDDAAKKLAARRKLLLAKRAQTLAFARVTAAIRSNVCWPPQEGVVRRLCRSVIDRTFHDDFLVLARRRGWVDKEIVKGPTGKEREKTTPWSSYDERVDQMMADMDNQDLLALALEATLIKQLTPDKGTEKWDQTERADLVELGRALEYDLNAELKKARLEVAPKVAAKKAPKKKAPKKKAPAKRRKAKR